MSRPDRKSTRLNSSHVEIYTLSLHDALPISAAMTVVGVGSVEQIARMLPGPAGPRTSIVTGDEPPRSEEHTSELQSRRDLHSFPTRRSSDLGGDDGGWRRIRGADRQNAAGARRSAHIDRHRR